jgi:hypothetical protein
VRLWLEWDVAGALRLDRGQGGPVSMLGARCRARYWTSAYARARERGAWSGRAGRLDCVGVARSVHGAR